MTTIREACFRDREAVKNSPMHLAAASEMDQREAKLRDWFASLPAAAAMHTFSNLSNLSMRPMLLADPDVVRMVFALADQKFTELFLALLREVREGE